MEMNVSESTLNTYVNDILSLSLEHAAPESALVVVDHRSKLSTLLANAYRSCLPHAQWIDFDAVTPEFVLAAFEALKPKDLVVMIQSSSFRLNAFRIRVELFKRHLKVIEHPHLGRIEDVEIPYYIESLAYDPSYYRGVGLALKARMDQARSATVESGGELLIYDSPLELAKLNIGDYSSLPNIGGQFPIGEVFTEAQDVEKVNGRVRIGVFGDTQFKVNVPPIPITLEISQGRIRNVLNSTQEFDRILEKITQDEGEVWVRELGFGMNRAFTHTQRVSDIGSYERMCGVHLSLGTKHGVYKKPQFNHRAGGYHVDVFPVTEKVWLDDQLMYHSGAWHV